MPAVQETVDRVRRIDVDQYRYGFETLIESDKAPKGLSEDTVRFISAKKNEPAWMLEWRLEAYRRWLTMTEPTWARVNYPKIDYQDLYYYSAPKPKKSVSSLDEIDPEILKTYEKLGIPLREVEVLEGVVRPEGEVGDRPSAGADRDRHPAYLVGETDRGERGVQRRAALVGVGWCVGPGEVEVDDPLLAGGARGELGADRRAEAAGRAEFAERADGGHQVGGPLVQDVVGHGHRAPADLVRAESVQFVLAVVPADQHFEQWLAGRHALL